MSFDLPTSLITTIAILCPCHHPPVHQLSITRGSLTQIHAVTLHLVVPCSIRASSVASVLAIRASSLHLVLAKSHRSCSCTLGSFAVRAVISVSTCLLAHSAPSSDACSCTFPPSSVTPWYIEQPTPFNLDPQHSTDPSSAHTAAITDSPQCAYWSFANPRRHQCTWVLAFRASSGCTSSLQFPAAISCIFLGNPRRHSCICPIAIPPRHQLHLSLPSAPSSVASGPCNPRRHQLHLVLAFRAVISCTWSFAFLLPSSVAPVASGSGPYAFRARHHCILSFAFRAPSSVALVLPSSVGHQLHLVLARCRHSVASGPLPSAPVISCTLAPCNPRRHQLHLVLAFRAVISCTWSLPSAPSIVAPGSGTVAGPAIRAVISCTWSSGFRPSSVAPGPCLPRRHQLHLVLCLPRRHQLHLVLAIRAFPRHQLHLVLCLPRRHQLHLVLCLPHRHQPVLAFRTSSVCTLVLAFRRSSVDLRSFAFRSLISCIAWSASPSRRHQLHLVLLQSAHRHAAALLHLVLPSHRHQFAILVAFAPSSVATCLATVISCTWSLLRAVISCTCPLPFRAVISASGPCLRPSSVASALFRPSSVASGPLLAPVRQALAVQLHRPLPSAPSSVAPVLAYPPSSSHLPPCLPRHHQFATCVLAIRAVIIAPVLQSRCHQLHLSLQSAPLHPLPPRRHSMTGLPSAPFIICIWSLQFRAYQLPLQSAPSSVASVLCIRPSSVHLFLAFRRRHQLHLFLAIRPSSAASVLAIRPPSSVHLVLASAPSSVASWILSISRSSAASGPCLRAVISCTCFLASPCHQLHLSLQSAPSSVAICPPPPSSVAPVLAIAPSSVAPGQLPHRHQLHPPCNPRLISAPVLAFRAVISCASLHPRHHSGLHLVLAFRTVISCIWSLQSAPSSVASGPCNPRRHQVASDQLQSLPSISCTWSFVNPLPSLSCTVRCLPAVIQLHLVLAIPRRHQLTPGPLPSAPSSVAVIRAVISCTWSLPSAPSSVAPGPCNPPVISCICPCNPRVISCTLACAVISCILAIRAVISCIWSLQSAPSSVAPGPCNPRRHQLHLVLAIRAVISCIWSLQSAPSSVASVLAIRPSSCIWSLQPRRHQSCPCNPPVIQLHLVLAIAPSSVASGPCNPSSVASASLQSARHQLHLVLAIRAVISCIWSLQSAPSSVAPGPCNPRRHQLHLVLAFRTVISSSLASASVASWSLQSRRLSCTWSFLPRRHQLHSLQSAPSSVAPGPLPSAPSSVAPGPCLPRRHQLHLVLAFRAVISCTWSLPSAPSIFVGLLLSLIGIAYVPFLTCPPPPLSP
ncbi:hypothetical protein C7M84_017496 [Penaeus vannamei]|uniref:Uncharacterized protein n=1 Tax=Penaeus vannamei TaxID=6689 RepID=A0A423SK35_PENVA|nr:hypothetical protein C7M84_017496 [Penaeus vannamei]